MRFVPLAAIFVVALWPVPAQPQDKKGDPEPVNMRPSDFKTGLVGRLARYDGATWHLKVVRVIDEKSMVLLLLGEPRLPFLANTPTKDMVDGKMTNLSGVWRVTGTTKVDGRTMFAIEPVPEKKK